VSSRHSGDGDRLWIVTVTDVTVFTTALEAMLITLTVPDSRLAT